MENKERILEASEHLAVVIPQTTILMLCLCEPMSECKLGFCYLQRKNLLKQCWLLSSCPFLQLLTQGLAFKRGSINLAIDTMFCCHVKSRTEAEANACHIMTGVWRSRLRAIWWWLPIHSEHLFGSKFVLLVFDQLSWRDAEYLLTYCLTKNN